MRSQMDAAAPWLYDVDVDAEDDREELLLHASELCEQRLGDVQVQRLSGQRCILVRCHGVLVDGAACSRTAWLPTDELSSEQRETTITRPASKYCYRHRYQQRGAPTQSTAPSWRSVSCSLRICCGAQNQKPSARPPRTHLASRFRVCGSIAFSMVSVICLIAGVYRRDASLCLVGTVGLCGSVVVMCVVTCEILCHALPTALVAQAALDALQAQCADTSHQRGKAMTGDNEIDAAIA